MGEEVRGIGIIHPGRGGGRGVARAATVGVAVVITMGGEDRLGTVVGGSPTHALARERGGGTLRSLVPAVREGDLSTGSTVAPNSQVLVPAEFALGELRT